MQAWWWNLIRGTKGISQSLLNQLFNAEEMTVQK